VPFSASYVAGGTGRYTISNFSGFTPAGLTYAAYPSSGGTLLLEIDTVGVTTGAAYTQTSTATFATASQGFGLNLSGDNLSSSGIDPVDDIAEFTATPSGTTVTGLIDENYYGATVPFFDEVLAGTYGSTGTARSQITATTGTSTSPGTLNGGFTLTLYTVDGTTFPFIEYDSGQVSAGVIVAQNPSASSAAAAHSNMFVVRPMFHPHAARQKKN
jgi:hypothetical protein